jgi:hypothetical protein
MRRYCDGEENHPKDFDRFTLFQHLQMQRIEFWSSVSVPITSTWMFGWILLTVII